MRYCLNIAIGRVISKVVKSKIVNIIMIYYQIKIMNGLKSQLVLIPNMKVSTVECVKLLLDSDYYVNNLIRHNVSSLLSDKLHKREQRRLLNNTLSPTFRRRLVMLLEEGEGEMISKWD